MSDDVYDVIFRVAEALELPVIVLALVALALVVFEVGVLVTEQRLRWGRRLTTLTAAATEARVRVDAGERDAARTALVKVAWSARMDAALDVLVAETGRPGGETRIAKELADFDFAAERRLGRTRLLVRAGPALGLMGTLIPLSPALEGLADGDVATLTENLRVAFSITVLGLLIGAIAFGLSLVRDRMYGQDYSDLEYVAAVLTAPADETEREVRA